MVQERSFKGLLDDCYQFMNLYIVDSHYYLPYISKGKRVCSTGYRTGYAKPNMSWPITFHGFYKVQWLSLSSHPYLYPTLLIIHPRRESMMPNCTLLVCLVAKQRHKVRLEQNQNILLLRHKDC